MHTTDVQDGTSLKRRHPMKLLAREGVFTLASTNLLSEASPPVVEAVIRTSVYAVPLMQAPAGLFSCRSVHRRSQNVAPYEETRSLHYFMTTRIRGTFEGHVCMLVRLRRALDCEHD